LVFVQDRDGPATIGVLAALERYMPLASDGVGDKTYPATIPPMKSRAACILLSYAIGIVLLVSGVWLATAFGALSPSLLRLANGDVRIDYSTTAGLYYRIEVSNDLQTWVPMMTLRSPGVLQHTDTAAGYNPAKRFYRVGEVTGTNILTGDHLVTDSGDVIFHPINHASFVMSWNGKMIYSDPVGGSGPYQNLQKADLILVTHDHGDHFSSSTIDAVRATGATIVAPQYVYDNSMSAAQRSITTVLANGANTNVLGLNVAAVPAYNANHPLGRGNGYVLTIGGRRIFISGDTGDVAEIRTLPNIDVAFLCMNVPFTMNITQAASTVRQMKPKVVFPYHFRNQDGTFADLNSFRQQVGTDLGIEVRVRTWY
jgi:L-ascorbate metabolism protein UlaG (beta-lactamase superfamily)